MDFEEDFGDDFGGDFEEDFGEDFGQDFGEDFEQDFGENFEEEEEEVEEEEEEEGLVNDAEEDEVEEEEEEEGLVNDAEEDEVEEEEEEEGLVNDAEEDEVEEEEDLEEDEEEEEVEEEEEEYLEEDEEEVEEEDDHYENVFLDEYEDEENEELIPVEVTRPRVSTSIADGRFFQEAVVINDGLLHNSNSCEVKPMNRESGVGDGGKESLNVGQMDGIFCPICYEAWTSSGEHQICCLPCGHIYGLSCINKWLQQHPNSQKCPQCKGLCTLKDVRVLYAAQLCAVVEELQKRVRLLEAECAYLKQKTVDESVCGEMCKELDAKQKKL